MQITTFRGGRNAPHPETTHPRIKFGNHFELLAPPPKDVDWYSNVADWPMFLNDQIGDCTTATVGHILESTSQYGQHDMIVVADSDVLAEYERVAGYTPSDPSTDTGAVIQDVLNDWRVNGVAGHKALAFAQVDPGNIYEVTSAIEIFGSLDIGLPITQSAMDQFNAGQPWDVPHDEGGVLGGHSVPAVGYDAQYLYVVTWGRLQKMTYRFWSRYVDEAWLVISPEWFDAHGQDPSGVDLYGIGQELNELTGDPNPFPAPAPTPTPAPPGPTPPDPSGVLAELAALIREVEADAAAEVQAEIAKFTAFLHAHGL